MNQIQENLLEAYFANQATDQEKQEIINLLDTDTEFATRFRQMEQAYAAAFIPAFEKTKKEDFKRLESRIQPRVLRISFWRPAAVAASVAAVVCLFAALYSGNNLRDAENCLCQSTVTTIASTRGTGTETILPDGTRACLNAGSTIKFGRSFGRKVRDIELEGEGYFEVAHNPAKPFRVHAGNACVTVKGTVFNVRSYADEANISVSLLEGSVLLTSPSSEVTLKPGTCGVVSRENGSIRLEKASHSVTGWTRGRIVFSDKSIAEILSDIQRTYGVHFIYDEGLFDEERFTGSISTSLTIDEILSYVDVDHKFTWQRKDDVISIRKK